MPLNLKVVSSIPSLDSICTTHLHRWFFRHQLRLCWCLTIKRPATVVTTGFGLSVYELYKSSTKCAQAYRAFASEYGNASPLFATFRNELEYVEQAIRLQKPINAWTGQEYASSVVFRGVLDEARLFAEKQRRIVDRGVQSGGHASLAELLPIALAAFEATLPRLQERIVHNRVGLLIFDITQLLQKSFDLDSHTSLAQLHNAVTASGLSHEQSTHVEQLLRKLSSIGATYVRNSSDATLAAASNLPKPDILDSEFEGCLASICTLTGLPTHHLAVIPVDSFAESFSKDWWQNIVQSTSQISRAPETLTPETQIERECRVKIEIDGTPFEAYGYAIFRRCIYWRAERGSVSMEHRLSQSTRKCFPYTMHRMMNKPLTLTFLDMQDLSMKYPIDRVMACKPHYTFLTNEDYQVFQTDVRARELVHEFHVSSIRHKTPRSADAHNECVKVWNPPTSSVDRSISFPAVFGFNTKNYEFPLRWFNPPVVPLRTTTVRLEFTKEPGGVSYDNISEKPSSLRSSMRFKRRVGDSSTASAAAGLPSTASVRSVSTNMANSSYAPCELVSRLGYIEFIFERAADVDEFVAAVADPFVAATPTSWSSAPSLYADSSPSTAWSSSPLSFQGQGLPKSLSAYGTGPRDPTRLLQLPDAAMDKPKPVTEKSADLFILPEADFGELIISGDDGMDSMPPERALTPSSLLRDKNYRSYRKS